MNIALHAIVMRIKIAYLEALVSIEPSTYRKLELRDKINEARARLKF